MTPPKPRSARVAPAWAVALKMRRAQLGKSQEQVALDSGILNQTTVSELEGGRYEVSNLAIARLAGLARGLDWTLSELEEKLGLDFNLSSLDEPRAPASAAFTAKAKGYRIPKQALPPIPDTLIDAAIIYGDRPGMEGLKEYRWQRTMERLPHRRRPQTPEEWLALYLDLREKLDPPEPEE